MTTNRIHTLLAVRSNQGTVHLASRLVEVGTKMTGKYSNTVNCSQRISGTVIADAVYAGDRASVDAVIALSHLRALQPQPSNGGRAMSSTELSNAIQAAKAARRRWLAGEEYTEADLAAAKVGADLINARQKALGRKYGRSPRPLSATDFIRNVDRFKV